MVGDGREVGAVGRRGRLWGEPGGEREVLFVQIGEARFEDGRAGLESFRVEVACFEGGVVAVECAFGSPCLLAECSPLFFKRRSVCLPLLGGGVDCVADDVAVAVERGELFDDGGFEFVAGDALAVAAFRSELLSAGAGVVVVGAAVAFRAHADVGALATAAAQKPREQVVARVAATQRHVVAAFAQQPLRSGEGELVDQRLVQAGETFAAPDDAAEVGLVLQHPLHDRGLPARGGRGCVLVGEHAGDCRGPELLARVEIEDAPHRRCGALIGHDLLALVALVAERQSAGRPLAFPCAAFDSGGDAVDDRRVLELGEHRQHLQHHPTGSGAGVERLGRRAEHDVERVEFLGELRELAHLP